jgi:hypothetical protein
MTTSRSDQPKAPNAQLLALDPQGAAQVEAERKRLGITEADLERRRSESLRRPF